MAKRPYRRPTKPYELTNLKKWRQGQLPIGNGAQVWVMFAPESDSIGIDTNGTFYHHFLERTYGFPGGCIYPLLRQMAHIRRHTAAEVAHLRDVTGQLTSENAQVIRLRRQNAQSPWARGCRRQLGRIIEELGQVRDESKRRAVEWLELIVRPSEADGPDFWFGMDSLNRVNSGPVGARIAGATRALRERLFTLAMRDVSGGYDELLITEIIEELEHNIQSALTLAQELFGQALAKGLDADPDRNPHYLLHHIHWLVERLWIPPYHRARKRLMEEIKQIRLIIEDDNGKYKMGHISEAQWGAVAGLAHTMMQSLFLLSMRGPLERLILPLSEGMEGALSREESHRLVEEIEILMGQLEHIDDRNFEVQVKGDLASHLVTVYHKAQNHSYADAKEALKRALERGLI